MWRSLIKRLFDMQILIRNSADRFTGLLITRSARNNDVGLVLAYDAHYI